MGNTSPRHMPVLGNVHPIKIYLKEIVGPFFEIYVIELLGSMSTDEAWRHLRTECIDLPGVCLQKFVVIH